MASTRRSLVFAVGMAAVVALMSAGVARAATTTTSAWMAAGVGCPFVDVSDANRKRNPCYREECKKKGPDGNLTKACKAYAAKYCAIINAEDRGCQQKKVIMRIGVYVPPGITGITGASGASGATGATNMADAELNPNNLTDTALPGPSSTGPAPSSTGPAPATTGPAARVQRLRTAMAVAVKKIQAAKEEEEMEDEELATGKVPAKKKQKDWWRQAKNTSQPYLLARNGNVKGAIQLALQKAKNVLTPYDISGQRMKKKNVVDHHNEALDEIHDRHIEALRGVANAHKKAIAAITRVPKPKNGTKNVTKPKNLTLPGGPKPAPNNGTEYELGAATAGTNIIVPKRVSSNGTDPDGANPENTTGTNPNTARILAMMANETAAKTSLGDKLERAAEQKATHSLGLDNFTSPGAQAVHDAMESALDDMEGYFDIRECMVDLQKRGFKQHPTSDMLCKRNKHCYATMTSDRPGVTRKLCKRDHVAQIQTAADANYKKCSVDKPRGTPANLECKVAYKRAMKGLALSADTEEQEQE